MHAAETGLWFSGWTAQRDGGGAVRCLVLSGVLRLEQVDVRATEAQSGTVSAV